MTALETRLPTVSGPGHEPVGYAARSGSILSLSRVVRCLRPLATSWRVAEGGPGRRLLADNVSPHKTPAVRAWLERLPRITFHFTPTSASWMNQVETWFSVLSRQAIRRGSFRSVRELIAAIGTFIAHWNAGGPRRCWRVRVASGAQEQPAA